MMSSKKSIAVILTAACLAAGAGYTAGLSAGKSAVQKETDSLLEKQAVLQTQYDSLLEQQEDLQFLNRASIEKMSAEGTIYVIGHRSPDTDTVCSAIAYARLLSMLGYEAEAAVTESLNNETAFILEDAGVQVPPVLEDASGENIFLVDHSEYLQAAEGMQDAHIVGILDHHGVGSVTTGHQVVYEAKPIGSTASIIWLDYLNYGLEIDPVTAKLMLGAILSDTDGLTGGNVTETDKRAAEALAETGGISDISVYYRSIHEKKLSYEGMSGVEILFSDYKDYEASGTTFGIGLLSAIDEEAAKKLAEQMKEILPEGFAKKNVDLMYAAVSIRENGEKIDYIVPADDHSREVFEEAFPGYEEYDGTSYIFRNGGLGRKTKFVPVLTEFLGTHPHE